MDSLWRALTVCLLSVTWPAWAEAEIVDSFEAVEPSWRSAQTNCSPARVAVHRRVGDQVHSGRRSEYVRLNANGGTYFYLTHKIAHSRVIREFEPRLWVKSDRPGIQLMVRVVLPRTPEPLTGEPVRALLRGDFYSDEGDWQQLAVRGADRLLAREVLQIRSRGVPNVDAREAYVDMIVLNAYGGPGATHLWIDDLSYTPFPVGTSAKPRAVQPAQTFGPVESETTVGEGFSEHVRVNGNVMMAQGRPLMVRMIDHRGEPFGLLRGLGFNTVRLEQPPSAQILQQAADEGMWIVAPPPQPRGNLAVSRAHDQVLAWSLGQNLGGRDVQLTGDLVRDLRRRDIRARRPLLCDLTSHLWDYRTLGDIFVLPPPPIGGCREIAEYGEQLRAAPSRARFGGCVWATIQTDPLEQLWGQTRGFNAPAAMEHAYVEPDQIRLQTYQAVASGARGLYFRSRGPLDALDPVTQLRAKSLELINRELTLIEPWIQAGVCEGDVVNDEKIRASVLRTDRSQLLIVNRKAEHQQFAIGPTEREQISLVTAAISSSAEAFRITFATFQALRPVRVAGGYRITLTDGELTSLVLLTQHPQVMDHVARNLRDQGRRIAELRQQIGVDHLGLTTATLERLSAVRRVLDPTQATLADAQRNLQQGRQLLDRGDLDYANVFTNRAMGGIAAVRRSHLEQAMRAFPSPTSSPLCVDFALLPEHWMLSERMKDHRWSGNSLAAGGFENLQHMLVSGWEKSEQTAPGLTTHVELSLQAWSGKRSLLLQAQQAGRRRPGGNSDGPAIRIASAATPVKQGTMLRIHGRVRVDKPLQGDRRGLLIYDSLGGPDLAHRITTTHGWEEFAIYRAAPSDSRITLHFDLFGVGEVLLDSVSIASAQPLAQTTAPPATASRPR